MKPLNNNIKLTTVLFLFVGFSNIMMGQKCYLDEPIERPGFTSHGFKIQPDLKFQLADLTSIESGASISISLPLPNGKKIDLESSYAPIMESELIAKYPEIKSYKVHAEGYTGRIGYTYKGFHGILFTPEGTVYYDPIDPSNDSYYCYYRKDYTEYHKGTKAHMCQTEADPVETKLLSISNANRGGERSGDKLRTYRLALACTGEYAQFHGGSITGALSAFVVSMNRVNGVYEREFSITMVLVNNTDDLIFLNANSDPYTNNSGGQMLGQNQSTVNSFIGSSNYDIGHVFSTGGGGVAALGSVCSFQDKARGVTGSNSPTGDPFDIDYVAHEMGHQFGGNHTQNNDCNRAASAAYEPGSASTIMGYAGICAPNVQNNSDDYFHAHSYAEVINFTHNGNGNSCASISNTGHTAPLVTVPNGGFFIPIDTPFRLDGSATDSDGDDIKYSWEEMDLGSSGHPDNPSGNAPIFRSFDPTEHSYRVCPRMVNIIIGNTVLGETYPTYGRDLTFRLTARDYNSAGGGVDFEEIEFEVSEDAGPFVVTSPSLGESIEAGGGYEITWNIAGTDQSPVNCQTVHIELCKYESTTQKLNVIDTLAFNTPNDGSEVISFSIDDVGGGYYVRVRAADNIFFNLNGSTFSILEPSPLEEQDILLALQPDYVNGMLALSWNDDFSNETNWYVEKSIGSNQSFFSLDTLDSDTTSYFDFDVIMYGVEYYYRVYTENTVSISAMSNEVVYEGLGVDEMMTEAITIFPNPTNGKITLISEHQLISEVTVYSLQGSLLVRESFNSTNAQINLSNLQSGIFLMRIKQSQGYSMHRIELLE